MLAHQTFLSTCLEIFHKTAHCVGPLLVQLPSESVHHVSDWILAKHKLVAYLCAISVTSQGERVLQGMRI